LGYLADRGIDQEKLDMVRVPAGLDLGHVSHREIAVCVLAELVKLRAAGELPIDGVDVAEPADKTAEAVDPVCGMTVPADESSRPFEYQGQRSEEHTSELQSRENLVCRLLLEKKKPLPDYPRPPSPERCNSHTLEL